MLSFNPPTSEGPAMPEPPVVPVEPVLPVAVGVGNPVFRRWPMPRRIERFAIANGLTAMNRPIREAIHEAGFAGAPH
jgi:hypothetical protein